MSDFPAHRAVLPASTQARVYVAMLIQTAISAGTYLVAKYALGEIDSFSLVICRFLLSSAVFAIILVVTPGPVLPPRSAIGSLLFLGMLAGPINQGFFFYGLQRSTAAHAALLYALTPLAVYVISVLQKRERATPRAALGITVAFSGVVVLLLGRGLKSASGPLYGDLFILAAMVAWALYTAQGKAFVAAHGAIRGTCWTMIAGTLLILPVAPFELNIPRVLAASAGALASIVYLGLLTSVVSYLLWYYALSKTEPSKVAVFSNLQPVATALAAWAILGDPLNWEIAVGGLLVLAGVRLTQRA